MIMSVQKISLLILVTSMQAFLLQAKSLGSESSIAINDVGGNDKHENIIHTTKRTADSSCAPDVSQLQYFSQLYSGSAAISSSNGNTMYVLCPEGFAD